MPRESRIEKRELSKFGIIVASLVSGALGLAVLSLGDGAKSRLPSRETA